MRTTCANPKCGDVLVRKRYGPIEAYGVARLESVERTGRVLCPACWYLGKRVFGAAVAVTGTVCGVVWWAVNHFMK